MFALFGLLLLLVTFGQRGGETFFSNPGLAITGILAAAAGVLAFIVGIIAIIKHKERSILVYLSTLLGLFILLFVVGEIVSPH